MSSPNNSSGIKKGIGNSVSPMYRVVAIVAYLFVSPCKTASAKLVTLKRVNKPLAGDPVSLQGLDEFVHIILLGNILFLLAFEFLINLV